MVSVDAKIDPASLAALGKAIHRVQSETGRAAGEAVAYAGSRVCRSAAKRSKPSKKTRPVVENPSYKETRRKYGWARRKLKQGKPIPENVRQALTVSGAMSPFYVEVYRQGVEQPERVPVSNRSPSNPFRKIKEAGLARKLWTIAGAKCLDTKRNHSERHLRVSKYTEKWGTTAGQSVCRIVNRLSYLTRAYPGIVQESVLAGTAALVGELNRKLKRATSRA